MLVLAYIDHWALLIIDRPNKSYYLLYPKDADDNEKFHKLILGKLKLPKTFKENQFTVNTTRYECNTGIFVHNYMIQYLNTGSVSHKRFSPDAARNELEQNVLKHSVSMTDSCLICGLDTDDNDSTWGECTNCNRWIHCSCGKTILKEIEDDDNFRCDVCLGTSNAY